MSFGYWWASDWTQRRGRCACCNLRRASRRRWGSRTGDGKLEEYEADEVELVAGDVAALRLGHVGHDSVERLDRRGRVAALPVAEDGEALVNCRYVSMWHARAKRTSVNSSTVLAEGNAARTSRQNSRRAEVGAEVVRDLEAVRPVRPTVGECVQHRRDDERPPAVRVGRQTQRSTPLPRQCGACAQAALCRRRRRVTSGGEQTSLPSGQRRRPVRAALDIAEHLDWHRKGPRSIQ